jgi:ABC-type uncharacterized transport system permease subunit
MPPPRTRPRQTTTPTGGWPASATPQAVLIGSAQILALLPGISRSGVTMVAGLARGLSHEDAARFAFLLATPVILAAGALKIPDLAGSLGNGIRGQILAGSLFSGIGAYVSVRFLLRYFQTRTLTPLPSTAPWPASAAWPSSPSPDPSELLRRFECGRWRQPGRGGAGRG